MIESFTNKHNMVHITRPMEVQKVPCGIVLPKTDTENGPRWGLGGVCDEHNEFVALSAYDGGWASHGGKYEWEDEESVDCDAVYFGVFFHHWGHFLIDLIGRLWYFAKNRSSRVKLAILGEEMPRGNFLEFFSLLGIAEEDILLIRKPTRFRHVIVPEFSCKSCEWYSSEYVSIFDTMIAKIEEEGYRPSELPENPGKVYFSRLSFGKAKQSEFGENNISAWLEANGFLSAAPEKLSVRDQIYIWNHAEEIACLDGSIPMSIAFSNNPSLKLLIMHKTSLEHLNVELYLLMRPCEAVFLDVWYEPFRGYPKNIGAGPFLLHPGEDAREYSRLHGWKFPFEDGMLKKERRKNCLKLAWRILNLDGRLRLLASRVLPKSVKSMTRRILKRGG